MDDVSADYTREDALWLARVLAEMGYMNFSLEVVACSDDQLKRNAIFAAIGKHYDKLVNGGRSGA